MACFSLGTVGKAKSCARGGCASDGGWGGDGRWADGREGSWRAGRGQRQEEEEEEELEAGDSDPRASSTGDGAGGQAGPGVRLSPGTAWPVSVTVVEPCPRFFAGPRAGE